MAIKAILKQKMLKPRIKYNWYIKATHFTHKTEFLVKNIYLVTGRLHSNVLLSVNLADYESHTF